MNTSGFSGHTPGADMIQWAWLDILAMPQRYLGLGDRWFYAVLARCKLKMKKGAHTILCLQQHLAYEVSIYVL